MNIGGRLVRLMAASSLILFGACKSPTDSTIVNIEITDTTNVNNGGGGNGGGVVGGNGQCSSGQSPVITFEPNSASGNIGSTQPVTVHISCGPTSGNFSTTNTNGSVSSSGLVTFVSAGTFQVCYTLASGFKACSGTWTTNASGTDNQPTVTAVTIGNPHVTYSTCNAWPGQPFNYTVSTTGGASTAVTFELLTHHAVQSINSSTGMMTLFSPAVAGTDTIKIASAFDPTKFALAEFTVTLCGGNNGGNTITVPSDTVELSLCTNGASGTTTYKMKVYMNGAEVPYSDLNFMVDSNGISVTPNTGVVTPVALGWHRVRIALKNDPNATTAIWFHVTNTNCQAPPPPVNNISVVVRPPTLDVQLGQFGQLTAEVQNAPANGTWSSTSNCVSISANGLVAIITGTSVCSGVTVRYTLPTGEFGQSTVNITSPSAGCTIGGPTSVVVNNTANMSANCGTTNPWWFSHDASLFTVVGAPYVCVYGGVPFPCGPTATIKAIAVGQTQICVQPSPVDTSHEACQTETAVASSVSANRIPGKRNKYEFPLAAAPKAGTKLDRVYTWGQWKEHVDSLR
jgi:hypothetical protein